MCNMVTGSAYLSQPSQPPFTLTSYDIFLQYLWHVLRIAFTFNALVLTYHGCPRNPCTLLGAASATVTAGAAPALAAASILLTWASGLCETNFNATQLTTIVMKKMTM